MSDTNISSIGKILATNATVLTGSEKTDQVQKPDFSAMISQTGAKQADNVASQTKSQVNNLEASKDNKTQSTASDYEKYQYKDKKIQSTKEASETPAKDVVEERVSAFEEKVKDILKEELGVTEEEIASAMETLGLGYTDLLDQNQLAKLVSTLTGTENVSQLLCSGQFVGILQCVKDAATDLLQSLQMTQQELQDFLKIAEENEAIPTEDAVPSTADNTVVENSAEIVENAVDKKVAEETTVVAETDVTKTDAIKTDATKTESTEETPAYVFQTESNGEKEAAMNQQSSEEQMTDEQPKDVEVELLDGRAKGRNHFQGILNQNEAQTVPANQNTVVDNLSNVEVAAPLPEYVNVRDIIDQIMDTARVTLTQDLSKMEMQLNPENLGKIIVEITEKDGVVSAKLETQNFLVKEALEAQVAELRQNLNQAGVKVDAVEVTVASHEFERNLEQGAEGQKQQAEEQEKATRQRRINIGDLDELSGIMSEEEALVAKIMSEQGNSIDYTA